MRARARFVNALNLSWGKNSIHINGVGAHAHTRLARTRKSYSYGDKSKKEEKPVLARNGRSCRVQVLYAD